MLKIRTLFLSVVAAATVVGLAALVANENQRSQQQTAQTHAVDTNNN